MDTIAPGFGDSFAEIPFADENPRQGAKLRFHLSGWPTRKDRKRLGHSRLKTVLHLILRLLPLSISGPALAGLSSNHPCSAVTSVGAIPILALAAHFYETRWFLSGCFLSVIAAGAAGFALARHRYLSQERRLSGDRQALETERRRIARDLHDDLGANLTGLAMQAENAGNQLAGPGGEALRDFAFKTRSLAQRLREVIWAVDPESDTLESLTAFLGQQADQLIGPTRLRYRFDSPPNLPRLKLRAGTRHQLAMSAREALNNALKYAEATEVSVSVYLAQDTLGISILDNGVGLPAGSITSSGRPVTGGQGLKNIRERLQSLGGKSRIESQRGGGTLVRLEVPLSAVKAVESRVESYQAPLP